MAAGVKHPKANPRTRNKKRRRQGGPLSKELRAISERIAALPVLDPRTPEEILDYDERGAPR